MISVGAITPSASLPAMKCGNIKTNVTRGDRRMKKVVNTMIRNQKDLEEQSEMMEKMKTNKQVKENGKIPDPIQYETNNRKESSQN
ncbi:hypothetical protein [Metabacillus halosaccharovorans]|uniref:hypothetical protein n=1 Tax=Metabacillus halosaccharovorans TaxID=930124 RepID=UPI0009951482|nr:hypothetical protein [Metabacillus halosaccharovorans]